MIPEPTSLLDETWIITACISNSMTMRARQSQHVNEPSRMDGPRKIDLVLYGGGVIMRCNTVNVTSSTGN